MPSWCFSTLGAAVAVQIGLASLSLRHGTAGWLLVGLAVFTVVSGVQLLRLRRLDGGLERGVFVHRVLGGGGGSASSYVVALAAAVWAAASGPLWLAASFSVLGGTLYAWYGRRWVLGEGQASIRER